MRTFARAFERFQKKDQEIRREAREIYEHEMRNSEKKSIEDIRKKIDTLS